MNEILMTLADAVLDTVMDCLKTLPFLFAAFLLLEALEHRSGEKLNRFFVKSGKASPLIGALLGCIPQCGFSVLAANLYCGGAITLGTLLAVFTATSDEAVLILLADPKQISKVLPLLGVKIAVALLAGYLTDFLLRKRRKEASHDMEELCAHCGCHEQHGIFRPALYHTAKTLGFLFLITALINIVTMFAGEERLSALLLGNSVLQPFVSALIGLIPNCAPSVILTKLYMSGALRFSSVIAGLCPSAGMGIAMLFRGLPKKREFFKILGILYAVGVAAGLILRLFGI